MDEKYQVFGDMSNFLTYDKIYKLNNFNVKNIKFRGCFLELLIYDKIYKLNNFDLQIQAISPILNIFQHFQVYGFMLPYGIR